MANVWDRYMSYNVSVEMRAGFEKQTKRATVYSSDLEETPILGLIENGKIMYAGIGVLSKGSLSS